MPHTTISAGMSVKRPGTEQYSSDGYHLTVEMEAEVENADHFRAVTQALFSEVKTALEVAVADGSARAAGAASGVDLWGAGGNGGNGGDGRKPVSRPTRTDTKGDRVSSDPISNKQAKFLFQLARRSGMKTQPEVTGWIHEKLGVEKGVYDLTKVEASRAIDLLNNGNGGSGK